MIYPPPESFKMTLSGREKKFDFFDPTSFFLHRFYFSLKFDFKKTAHIFLRFCRLDFFQQPPQKKSTPVFRAPFPLFNKFLTLTLYI